MPQNSERNRPEDNSASSESLEPSPLPAALAEFLRDTEVACLMQGTDQGTAFVIKLSARDIHSARGTVPIYLRHELYAHPAAPVIRTILVIYDQPETPFALETYTNIEDEQQRNHFAALTHQDALILLFYDEQLAHRLTKVVPQSDPEQSALVLATAERVLATIPKEQFDFDRAKQAVMEATDL
jgi:hypothetical protein